MAAGVESSQKTWASYAAQYSELSSKLESKFLQTARKIGIITHFFSIDSDKELVHAAQSLGDFIEDRMSDGVDLKDQAHFIFDFNIDLIIGSVSGEKVDKDVCLRLARRTSALARIHNDFARESLESLHPQSSVVEVVEALMQKVSAAESNWAESCDGDIPSLDLEEVHRQKERLVAVSHRSLSAAHAKLDKFFSEHDPASDS